MKFGDLVVFADPKTFNKVFEIYVTEPVIKLKRGNLEGIELNGKEIRLATEEEIKAGHRL